VVEEALAHHLARVPRGQLLQGGLRPQAPEAAHRSLSIHQVQRGVGHVAERGLAGRRVGGPAPLARGARLRRHAAVGGVGRRGRAGLGASPVDSLRLELSQDGHLSDDYSRATLASSRHTPLQSGRSSAWLEHSVWGRKAAGSNPAAPIS
jgi:hypothetical protein